MKLRSLTYGLVLLLLLASTSAFAEKMVFDMSVFGYKFGEMVLTRTVVNDSIERYTLNAKGKTDFFFMKRDEESKFEVEYRNGKLFSSDYEYLNKGEREKWSKVRFEGGRYVVQSHEGTKEMSELLDYSLIRLYFDPTWKRERIFCEEDCSYASMTRTSNTVNIKCQDGSRSTYHVQDGMVEKMEIHLALATVKLTRRH